ncbi:MAG: isoprenyl transferase [Phycisphaerae bacterium]|nr:isoprenyl transferase [Phycisphaerae bacterium]
MNKDESIEIHPILGIPWSKMPRHVAIIMDGNGRWAQKRGLPRLEGHRNGSKGVQFTLTEAARLGLEVLTLYSFSTENWKRPPEEVAGLMKLYQKHLIEERPTIMANNISVRHLGSEKGLPDFVIKELRESVEMSKNNTGMVLCLALNYSGRSEILSAVKKIAGEFKDGSIGMDEIDEELISKRLDTGGLPDPDLLIRTAGEMRISNYLLWQISYAELYVTEEFWPDFDREVMHKAILDYSKRKRRFGGLSPSER